MVGMLMLLYGQLGALGSPLHRYFVISLVSLGI